MKRLICLTMICFLEISTAAESSIWDVKPTECVVTKAEQVCDTTISISLLIDSTNLPGLCVYADQQWMGCFHSDKRVIRFPLTIRKPVTIALKSDDGHTLGDHIIEYTVIEATQQRRRVRLPWSVF